LDVKIRPWSNPKVGRTNITPNPDEVYMVSSERQECSTEQAGTSRPCLPGVAVRAARVHRKAYHTLCRTTHNAFMKHGYVFRKPVGSAGMHMFCLTLADGVATGREFSLPAVSSSPLIVGAHATLARLGLRPLPSIACDSSPPLPPPQRSGNL